ncbi:antibiotic biosynthesis monooxygenase [Kitasatospora sp. GAS204B]|uniref:putative quinol monooxygenase n=1 Tax=unclassified Kitasatospora TaxID=2633591 RepID=UPI002474CD79|nr:antibiotic biosynthesis monooxygenase [Kitasatospora sp. GAS204B]MDH6119605.1 quinol monooxygenase YgiN [Kitasatospora sp. GAS204B]
MTTTPRVGLLVRLEAKPEHVEELNEFLTGALPLAQAEAGTTVWFALRLGPTTFGIFDAFGSDEGRQAHVQGEIAKALFAAAPRLLAQEPEIVPVDVLAVKLP